MRKKAYHKVWHKIICKISNFFEIHKEVLLFFHHFCVNLQYKVEIMNQINAFAMQNGIFYGLYGVLAGACYLGGLSMPWLSTFFMLMMLSAPVFVAALTFRFRKTVAPEGHFTFSRGFWHTLLTSTYAALIVAVMIFVYLKWMDNGFVFTQYEQMFAQPEIANMIKVSGMDEAFRQSYGMTFLEMVKSLRNFPPAYFAFGALEMLWVAGVIISLIVGLIAKRN